MMYRRRVTPPMVVDFEPSGFGRLQATWIHALSLG